MGAVVLSSLEVSMGMIYSFAIDFVGKFRNLPSFDIPNLLIDF